MDNPKIAVVTGGNRGLGFEIARQLAKNGCHVIITARDARAGADALQKLENENLSVELRRLDVISAEQAQSLADYVRDTHGQIDALVNNAGVFLESSGESGERSADVFEVSPSTVMETFNINTLGPLRLTQALAPLLRDNACVVNVSSGMGALNGMDGGYLGYRVSKTALNTLTRVLSNALAARDIKVNSVCPGWVRTDMGGPNATRSLEQGAETIVWAASLGTGGPTGGFFRDKQAIDW
ncbi:MAG: SDR family NAD(P)-dependent oxidoreductase [Gammaproteobacteria bacterium]|nr:SDR family NAD(P)-dependent oxidoreductase [Gammaproteobacteria bacterium]